ncbi:fungal zn(2)-Cys(6) binuclear cluster domain-containing protein [Trichoderma breve]|uniref:Fungal zn(2)-Cys(6) binuclear cluster domain-containing protein n=1 Tax=Trichoderma breve TaxID=2034170 RepID=A0A9W9JSS7_9HYPO|nr:fungal zn(2)-Cys(6) binuclear cluster domain-containing protein [Trichoderma breve]KAJ4865576.1 fungal zn(2)-Cys(6) binuclear cluster domain-containing protein [Trichoderma breve]
MLMFGSPQLLRLSCDRCHKRKQRCTRTSATDENPCRRCKEADEKCVFSPPLRLGRPSKRQKQEGKQEEANYGGREGSFLAISNQELSTTISTAASTTATTIQDEIDSTMETSSSFSADGVGEIATSPSIEHHELACPSASMDYNIVATAFEMWPMAPHHYPDPAMSVTTPGLFCPLTTDSNDEAWSDVLGGKAHSEPPTSSHTDPLDPALIAMAGASTSDSAIGSMDNTLSETAEPAIMDPVSLLSQIQLKLHGIQTRRPPHAAELQVIMNQTVQIAQKFIEVMDQIIPPRTADSSPTSTHQQQQYTQTGTVDTVEIRLALICYIQILRSYKNLVHMLVNSVGTTERQQRLDLSDVVPVQIGTLHTVVSPRLQIALLVQLISQHTDEIRHKIRQLASRINETRPNIDPSHPGAFNSNIIGKDIRGEEEDLRDGLDLISERLKMHTQFQDHRSLDR